MATIEAGRAALLVTLLGTLDQLSEKDLQWITAIATRAATEQRKKEAFAAFIAGEVTTEAMYEMAACTR